MAVALRRGSRSNLLDAGHVAARARDGECFDGRVSARNSGRSLDLSRNHHYAHLCVECTRRHKCRNAKCGHSVGHG